ncbi:flagellar protein FlaG [Thioalkalivibrio sp.]|uniref:flagellar protein FlaG n=1 Tax=Thioalkalivibrio sp. TaxID=2093813 RepID=UPI0012D6B807|nr:flagellar protein FlaG [Thioalkalivibrio sp.]TVP83656.1 MAG: flagellar protein FlaG [Thioalkalivibrio sp.]
MLKESAISLLQDPLLTNVARAPKPSRADGRVEPLVAAGGGKELPSREVPEAPRNLPAVVESLNDYLQTVKRELQFSVDENSGRPVITVLDAGSKAVIRQIPSEAAVALAEHLSEQGGFDSVGLIEKA